MSYNVNARIDQLIADGVLACCLCYSRLEPRENGKITCVAGHVYSLAHNVLDLFAADATEMLQSTSEINEDAILSAITSVYGLDPDAVKAAQLLEDLKPTGNSFYDSEEAIFLERFAFVNLNPRLRVQKVYSNGKMRSGTTHTLAVRVINDSGFNITSSNDKPVCLSYHWHNLDGSIVLFEGMRSSLPIDLKPGQAVTAHVAVVVPDNVSRLRLSIVPVHEYVSWLESDGQSLEIEVVSQATPKPPRFEAGQPFSEELDNILSLKCIERNLPTTSDPLVGVEIGGGTTAIMSRFCWESGRSGTILNCDVSVRLLRVGALLSAKGDDPVTIHTRCDANRLPFRSGALDVAVFSRSLHHFEDPVRVLRECHRALKPGGILLLLCEPVAIIYDEPTKQLIRDGVNEQVFQLDAYEGMMAEAGFVAKDIAVDFGFSLKGAYRKAR